MSCQCCAISKMQIIAYSHTSIKCQDHFDHQDSRSMNNYILKCNILKCLLESHICIADPWEAQFLLIRFLTISRKDWAPYLLDLSREMRLVQRDISRQPLCSRICKMVRFMRQHQTYSLDRSSILWNHWAEYHSRRLGSLEILQVLACYMHDSPNMPPWSSFCATCYTNIFYLYHNLNRISNGRLELGRASWWLFVQQAGQTVHQQCKLVAAKYIRKSKRLDCFSS